MVCVNKKKKCRKKKKLLIIKIIRTCNIFRIYVPGFFLRYSTFSSYYECDISTAGFTLFSARVLFSSFFCFSAAPLLQIFNAFRMDSLLFFTAGFRSLHAFLFHRLEIVFVAVVAAVLCVCVHSLLILGVVALLSGYNIYSYLCIILSHFIYIYVIYGLFVQR